MKKKEVNESGITLVALVVTIIVLLVLAVVTIRIVLGENGLIQRSKDAGENMEISKITEELQLAVDGASIDYYADSEIGRELSLKGYIFSNYGMTKINESLSENATFERDNSLITYKGYSFIVGSNGKISLYNVTKIEYGELPDDFWVLSNGKGYINTKYIDLPQNIGSGSYNGGNYGEMNVAGHCQYTAIKIPKSIDGTEVSEFDIKNVDNIIAIDIPAGVFIDFQHLVNILKEIKIGTNSEEERINIKGYLSYLFGPEDSGFIMEENSDNNILIAKIVENITLYYDEVETESRVAKINITPSLGLRNRYVTIVFNGERVSTSTGDTTCFYVFKNGEYSASAISESGNETRIDFEVTKCLNRYDNREEKYSDIQGNNNTHSNYVEVTSKDNVTIPIPNGFAYGVSENVGSISHGFVITDEVDENGNSIGNEFVWIPIDKNTLSITVNGVEKAMAVKTTGTDSQGKENYRGKLYDFSGTTSSEISFLGKGKPCYMEPVAISSDADFSDITDESLQQEYNAMISSVKEYGGFYLARYEIGNDAFSKLGKNPDKNNWYAFYNRAKEYANSKTSIVSSMVWGSQYDAMLHYGLNNTNDSNKVTGAGIGAYQGIEKTGQFVGNDYINNVFDLCGNIKEYTLETYYTYYRVQRGGGQFGRSTPASNRYWGGISNTNTSSSGITTRIAIYIKE